jgi:hypothetical protein
MLLRYSNRCEHVSFTSLRENSDKVSTALCESIRPVTLIIYRWHHGLIGAGFIVSKCDIAPLPSTHLPGAKLTHLCQRLYQ